MLGSGLVKDAPRYLTSKEVALRRRRSTQALVMERKRGQGPPYIRDGRRYLYREDDIERWLANHWVDPIVSGPRPPILPSPARRSTADTPQIVSSASSH